MYNREKSLSRVEALKILRDFLISRDYNKSIIKNPSYLGHDTCLTIDMIQRGDQGMSHQELDNLRTSVDELNLEILRLINERAAVVQEIGKVKEKQGVNRYDPLRERHMLNLLKENNAGPLPQSTVDHIFKEIFKTALELQEDDHRKALLVSRKKKAEDTVVVINGEHRGRQTFIRFRTMCS